MNCLSVTLLVKCLKTYSYCVQPSLGLVLSAYHQAVFPTDGFFDELDRRGRERGELLYVHG